MRIFGILIFDTGKKDNPIVPRAINIFNTGKRFIQLRKLRASNIALRVINIIDKR